MLSTGLFHLPRSVLFRAHFSLAPLSPRARPAARGGDRLTSNRRAKRRTVDGAPSGARDSLEPLILPTLCTVGPLILTQWTRKVEAEMHTLLPFPVERAPLL